MIGAITSLSWLDYKSKIAGLSFSIASPALEELENFKMAKPVPLFAYVLAACLSRVSGVSAAFYTLTDTVVGNDFYDFFEWRTRPDPSHGRVHYVDQPTAQSLNLTYTDGSTFIVRTEATNVLDPAGRGCSSIKLRSKKTYTHHIAVFDIRHLPQGCGTWPSIWEADEDSWPNSGEVDIVEGANDQGANIASLRTLPGCSMPASRMQTGGNTRLDCDSSVNSNEGCGVRFNPNSFGPSFNANGGGWYLLERTPEHIKVWFWDRVTCVFLWM